MKFPRLREKRKSQGLTRRFFESHNISERTIATLETDDCNPKIETIETVAKALNTTIDSLRGFEEKEAVEIKRYQEELELLKQENEKLKTEIYHKDQDLLLYLKELNELRKQLNN